jgi:hypothetical protein
MSETSKLHVRKPADNGSVQRSCLGEDGMIAVFFKMLCFPFNRIISHIISHIFGKGWFYKLIQFSYSKNGFPFIVDAYDTLTCGGKNPKLNECCEDHTSDSDCYTCIFCSPFFGFYLFLCLIPCYIIDLCFGVFQFAFGLITFVLNIFLKLVYKTDGLDPILISILHIWRALTRVTFIPAIFIPICADIKSFIENQGETEYTRMTWKDYVRVARYINIFSLRGFLIDEYNMSGLLLMIPLINIIMGIFHFVLGIITIPFTFMLTIICRTRSISWLEWSGIHILKGICGISVVGVYLYYVVFYHKHLKAIYDRCGFSGTVDSIKKNEESQKILFSYDIRFRTCSEFAEFINMLFWELNPYSMNYLYRKEGKMNIMDWMSVIPILGLIPAFFRIPMFFLWLTFGCFHTLCRKRVNRPSYFTIFGIYVGTGILAGSFVLTWVNYVIYILRDKIIDESDKEDSTESFTFSKV